jgi:aldehyde dehydrogenase (NAD+)
VTLELGGKSPVIVLDDVNVKDAARKIAWGKCLNAGQTCIAPDYLLCPSRLVNDLATEIAANVRKMYGPTEDERRTCESFVHIVESHAVERHKALIEDALASGAIAVMGGEFAENDVENCYTPVTILTGVTPNMKIMESELFGPILPIVAYDSLDDALRFVQERPKPLALYVFGKSQGQIDRVLANTTSGSACVNHCILQIENLSVPFGGVGMSGTGNYHGFYGFKTFSHERNVMSQGFFDSMSVLYPPYYKEKEKGGRARLQRLAIKFLG